MMVRQVHDALAQVRKLHQLILEKRVFRGYSGRSRILSGLAALAGAVLMGRDGMPPDPMSHLMGWGLVLALALLFNYGALAVWFLFDVTVRRDPIRLKPAVDALPALAVGALLSLALIRAGQFDLLFGVWMGLYGLAQTAYRQSLPRGISWVGLAYVLCGCMALVRPGPFLNPWPMGIIFFAGEFAGGLVLLRNGDRPDDRDREPTV